MRRIVNNVRSLFGCRALAFLLVLCLGTPVAAASRAAGFIEQLGNETITVLGDSKLDQSERERQFRRLLNEGFALNAIAQFTLGRYWRAATAEQQAEFRRLFEELVIKTYGSRLSHYSKEVLVVSDERPDGDAGSIVTTDIVRTNKPTVKIQWRVRPVGNGFKIVDVVAEGISMALTQQSEFAAVIRARGGEVEGLLEDLREKVATQK